MGLEQRATDRVGKSVTAVRRTNTLLVLVISVDLLRVRKSKNIFFDSSENPSNGLVKSFTNFCDFATT